ncbi:MAG: histidine phosphatase family protein [Anaerolineaceae bacterium]
MKQVFLMRHAKSSWKDANIPDHDRPLKKKGEKDVKTMAKMLKHKKHLPDFILCSSAERAKQTAVIFIKATSFEGKLEYNDKLYMAEVPDLIDAIKGAPKSAKSIMIIGHNPGLEALLQTLTGKVETLPTSSIAYISIPIEKWSELTNEVEGKLKKLWLPKDL